MVKKAKFSTTTTARNIVPVVGVAVDSGRREEVLNRAWGLVLSKSEAGSRLKKSRARLIVTPNPEIVSRAQFDHKLAEILNKADLALPDGIGLVLAAKLFEPKAKISRVPGRLLALDLIVLCAKHGKKVFLLGGQQGAAELAAKKLIGKWKMLSGKLDYAAGPWLNMDGQPVNFQESKVEQETIRQINTFKPDLLLVGFGAPKQEKWLARNLNNLDVKAGMVVGGMIDYTAGILHPAPSALSKAGFEWLWRLGSQPQRIGRIFTAVIVFPLQVLLYKLKGMRNK